MPDARFAGLTPLFAPRSVAVLGASSDPTRISGRPLAYMKAQGFQGALYPINPNRAEVQGLKAYPSVADLPETPDVAIVAIAAEIAENSITELAERGVKAAVMFTAGFAEMDEAGEAAQHRMVTVARKHGMRILGPNCLGVFDARTAYYATFSSSFDSGWPVPGRIGIASQSGAYGTHLYTLARNRGIGASLCIMTGNEADVTVGECIGWLAESPEVDVIAVYAEGIREAPGLIAAFEAARAAKKPIVMQKVGRSELGTKAAKSHTASIAGDDAVTEAVMAEFGVVRARNSEEMLDIAHTATRKIYPARNTLGVITVSGGAGVLMSDVAEAVGLPMPEMPEATQKMLRDLVPFCAPRNPVDATAQVSNDVTLIHTFTEAMVKDGGYASVLGFFSMTASSRRWPGIREQINKVREAYPDRLYALSVITTDDRRAELETDGWCVHEDPTRAVTAIAAMGRFGAAFAAPAARRSAERAAGHAARRDAERGGGEASACVRRHPVRAGAGMRQRRGSGCRSGTVRLPGGDEDPVARHRAQVGDRRRAAERRRCRRGARRLRSAAGTREARGADGTHRGRAGGEAVAGRRRVHPGHPPRSGVRSDRDVRPRRHLRRGDEGRGVPPLSVRRRCGGADDPFDQGRAAAAGRARPAEGGHQGTGAHAGAAVGIRACGRTAAGIDRSQSGVRHAGGPWGVRGGCGGGGRLVPLHSAFDRLKRAGKPPQPADCDRFDSMD